MGKIWFEDEQPGAAERAWFERHLGIEDRGELLGWVRSKYALADGLWDHVQQELLIFLWLHGYRACGESRENLLRLIWEFTDYEARNEKQRRRRELQRKGPELSESMAETELPDVDPMPYLAHLTPKQQDVVRWKYEDNFTEREIANKLGISQQAVDRILARAKAALAQALGEENHGTTD